MATQRMILDLRKSEKAKKLTASSFRFFVMLLLSVDDFGNIYASDENLRSQCFPIDTSIRLTDISRWGADCCSAQVIAYYMVAEKRFVHIFDFHKSQTLRWPKRSEPQSPFPDDDFQEKRSKKEGSEENKKVNRSESESSSLALLDDKKAFFNQCIKIILPDEIKQFFRAEYNQYVRAYKDACASKGTRIGESENASLFEESVATPARAEFDLFFNYYQARNWKNVKDPLFQWKVWLSRKKT